VGIAPEVRMEEIPYLKETRKRTSMIQTVKEEDQRVEQIQRTGKILKALLLKGKKMMIILLMMKKKMHKLWIQRIMQRRMKLIQIMMMVMSWI